MYQKKKPAHGSAMSSLWPTDAMSTCTVYDLQACQEQSSVCWRKIVKVETDIKKVSGERKRGTTRKKKSVKKSFHESNQLVRARSPCRAILTRRSSWRAFLMLILNSFNIVVIAYEAAYAVLLTLLTLNLNSSAAFSLSLSLSLLSCSILNTKSKVQR